MMTFQLKLITPLFCRGSYEDRAEIRPPSIRGQLHWWFRALGGSYREEKEIFGGVHSGATASKVVVRVQNQTTTGEWLPTLPHKPAGATPQDGPNAPRIAFGPGVSFQLHLLTRLGGLDNRLAKGFNKALETWLLLGTLGLRSTRAGGSFNWQPQGEAGFHAPNSFQAYEAQCQNLLLGAPLRFALLNQSFNNAEQPRKLVADTIGGPNGTGDWPTLDQANWPLGNVSMGIQRQRFQGAPRRKTSPLRFRIVNVGSEYRIAAVWDGRTEVTGNKVADLKTLINQLTTRKPQLGGLLAQSALNR